MSTYHIPEKDAATLIRIAERYAQYTTTERISRQARTQQRSRFATRARPVITDIFERAFAGETITYDVCRTHEETLLRAIFGEPTEPQGPKTHTLDERIDALPERAQDFAAVQQLPRTAAWEAGRHLHEYGTVYPTMADLLVASVDTACGRGIRR